MEHQKKRIFFLNYPQQYVCCFISCIPDTCFTLSIV